MTSFLTIILTRIESFNKILHKMIKPEPKFVKKNVMLGTMKRLKKRASWKNSVSRFELVYRTEWLNALIQMKEICACMYFMIEYNALYRQAQQQLLWVIYGTYRETASSEWYQMGYSNVHWLTDGDAMKETKLTTTSHRLHFSANLFCFKYTYTSRTLASVITSSPK